LESNGTVKPIALAKWEGCDTYTDCPTCGPHQDEALYLVLRKGRVHTFEVALDGTLVPICQTCAEKPSTDLARMISGGCLLCSVSPHIGGGIFLDDDRWICGVCWLELRDCNPTGSAQQKPADRPV
jgi:hypothetical protein